MTTSPPPEHNFDIVPRVHALDEFFHRKYEDVGEGDAHDLRQVATAEQIVASLQAPTRRRLHLPSPSYWPMIAAAALPVIAYGVIYHVLLSVVGVAILVIALFGWALEPSVEHGSDDNPPVVGPGVGTLLATIGETDGGSRRDR